jgi:hypothetical protein
MLKFWNMIMIFSNPNMSNEIKSQIFSNHNHFKLILAIFLFGLNAANAQKISALPNAPAVITADNVNLTAEFFFKEFNSEDKQANARAGLYLLGVADTTEGKTWCGYKGIKTVTMNEYVFLHFKKLPQEKMPSPRASHAKNKTCVPNAQTLPPLIGLKAPQFTIWRRFISPNWL